MAEEEFGLKLKISDETAEGFRSISENAKKHLSRLGTVSQPVTSAVAPPQPQSSSQFVSQQTQEKRQHREDRSDQYIQQQEERKKTKTQERFQKAREQAQGFRQDIGAGEQVGGFLATGGVQQGIHTAFGVVDKISQYKEKQRNRLESQTKEARGRSPAIGEQEPFFSSDQPSGAGGGVGRPGGGPKGISSATYKIQNAKITIAKGDIISPGGGKGPLKFGRQPGPEAAGGSGGGFIRAGFDRIFSRRRDAPRPPPAPAAAGKRSIIGRLGRVATAVGGGGGGGGIVGTVVGLIKGAVALSVGVSAAVVSQYAGMRKSYIGGQMPTIAQLGTIDTTTTIIGSDGKKKRVAESSLAGTGMSAAARAQAISAAQQEMGAELEIGGVEAGRKKGTALQRPMSKAIKFAVAQGLGGATGARMFAQVQEMGRHSSTSAINRDMGIMLGNANQAGVGFRQRGRFVQSAIDLTSQARTEGRFEDVRTTSGIMARLYRDRKNITGLAQAQRVTGKLGGALSGGLQGGNMMSQMAGMLALRKDPSIGIFGALKASQAGNTDENIANIRESGIFSGDRGKMLVAFGMGGRFKATESEAISNFFSKDALKENNMFRGRRKQFEKEIGFRGAEARQVEKVSFREEILAQGKVAEKSLEIQQGILNATGKLVESAGSILESIF